MKKKYSKLKAEIINVNNNEIQIFNSFAKWVRSMFTHMSENSNSLFFLPEFNREGQKERHCNVEPRKHKMAH